MLLPGSFATERIDSVNARDAEQRGVPVEQVVAEIVRRNPRGPLRRSAGIRRRRRLPRQPRASYVTGQMIRIDGGATRST